MKPRTVIVRLVAFLIWYLNLLIAAFGGFRTFDGHPQSYFWVVMTCGMFVLMLWQTLEMIGSLSLRLRERG